MGKRDLLVGLVQDGTQANAWGAHVQVSANGLLVTWGRGDWGQLGHANRLVAHLSLPFPCAAASFHAVPRFCIGLLWPDLAVWCALVFEVPGVNKAKLWSGWAEPWLVPAKTQI